jgi:hypothetical protein
MKFVRFVSAFALLTLSALSQAATLASFPFTVDTNPATITYPALSASFASALPQITPFIGNDGFGNVLEAYPMTTAISAATAISTSSYFTITVNASSAGPMALSQLLFEVGKGGASDPRGYFIRSSIDGYANDLFAQTLPVGATQAPAPAVVNLSGIAGMDRVNAITFRFYVYTPTPTTNSVDFRNLAVVGSQAPALPVPVNQLTWLLALALAVLGGALQIRQRK